MSAERDQVLAKYMAEKGLKSTRQRSLIIDTFFDTHGHHSVEEGPGSWPQNGHARVRSTWVGSRTSG